MYVSHSQRLSSWQSQTSPLRKNGMCSGENSGLVRQYHGAVPFHHESPLSFDMPADMYMKQYWTWISRITTLADTNRLAG